MTKLHTIIFALLIATTGFGQQAPDSSRVLDEVVVKAFAYNRPAHQVPAAIGVADSMLLNRFSNTTLVNTMNTISGVRMEERSPGSYRFSVRGSTLRSPFGVRNVKVYWNDLPFTDAGGNTYLNLLDFSMVGSAEVIKGPASSLYGAGTGGALLLHTDLREEKSLSLSSTVGSYGMWRMQAGARLSTKGSGTAANYFHQQSDGYRDQTQMSRDVIQAQASFRVNENRTLTGSIFYSDLYYQTPGGLTESEMEEAPTQSRPPAGASPGAAQQKAAVFNKTFYAGITHEAQVNTQWSNLLAVYAALTQFRNPSIRNYERRSEQGFGARSVTQYHRGKLSVNAGGEFQYSFSPIQVFDNNDGVIGTLQTSDEVGAATYMLFAQAEWELPASYYLTLGVSGNGFSIRFNRLSTQPVVSGSRDFSWQLSPRIALLKKIGESLSVYGSVSRGFSPPTVAELFPSSGAFDQSLEPEVGTSYELGMKGSALRNTLHYQLAVYTFHLDETIVVRRNQDDADYFVNAGKTRQRGAELTLAWKPFNQQPTPPVDVQLWTALTFTDYVFKNYIQNTTDYSGNKLTGSPDNVIAGGVDLTTRMGLYANLNMSHTGTIPLNDANTVYANVYTLANAKVGFQHAVGQRSEINVFVSAENLLDEDYSLGNDLNAFGGRYFNPAPVRNYYAGVALKYNLKRHHE